VEEEKGVVVLFRIVRDLDDFLRERGTSELLRGLSRR